VVLGIIVVVLALQAFFALRASVEKRLLPVAPSGGSRKSRTKDLSFPC
jgi:hypothetical protein